MLFVPSSGFEPLTSGTTIRRSNQLSYKGNLMMMFEKIIFAFFESGAKVKIVPGDFKIFVQDKFDYC